MFSEHEYYKLIPTDPEKNVRTRMAILKLAATNRQVRAGLVEMCRRDCLFWIRLFVYQFNPQTREKGPFIPWEAQEKAILGGDVLLPDGSTITQEGLLRCVFDQRDVRWPKSRKIGASWITLMVIVWLCLFHKNIKALVMSRDADTVDRADDPDSLFWKIRFILDHLPEWMKPPVKDKKAVIVIGSNVIAGEATVESASVGGRATIALMDEFGQFRPATAFEVFSMTKDVCACRVFVFTHKDTTGMAYSLCFDPKYARMREILIHWSMHPEYRKGLYRVDAVNGKTEVLDKGFDFNAICAHNIPHGKGCSDCKKFGKEAFEFVLEAKPIGGPFPFIRSPWYDVECQQRTDRDISMNLDINPRGASDQFFDGYVLSVIKRNKCRPPDWVGNLIYDTTRGIPIKLEEDPNGLLKLWCRPRGELQMPLARYGAGADISTGSGSSASGLSVGIAETGEKVLEYQNANIYAPDFAVFCFAVLKMFVSPAGTKPLLVWETQGGAAFAKRLIDLHYSPFYLSATEEAQVRPANAAAKKPGFNASPKNILTLMEEYRDALYKGMLTNYSEEAIDECLNFVYTIKGIEYKAKGASKLAASGATLQHGDIVKADALMYKMLKELGGMVDQVVQPNESINPRSSAYREWLAEKQDSGREEDLVWA